MKKPKTMKNTVNIEVQGKEIISVVLSTSPDEPMTYAEAGLDQFSTIEDCICQHECDYGWAEQGYELEFSGYATPDFFNEEYEYVALSEGCEIRLEGRVGVVIEDNQQYGTFDLFTGEAAGL